MFVLQRFGGVWIGLRYGMFLCPSPLASFFRFVCCYWYFRFSSQYLKTNCCGANVRGQTQTQNKLRMDEGGSWVFFVASGIHRRKKPNPWEAVVEHAPLRHNPRQTNEI